MRRGVTAGLILLAWMTVIQAGTAWAAPADEKRQLRVLSDQTVTGFAFPESVGCDAANKVLYVSQFGGVKPQPAGKDGLGKISRVSLDGKMLEEQFLPVPGETLNKPKSTVQAFMSTPSQEIVSSLRCELTAYLSGNHEEQVKSWQAQVELLIQQPR